MNAQRITLSIITLFLTSFSMAQEGLKNQFGIDGATTVTPLSLEATDRYMEDHRNFEIAVEISGAQGGFKKFVNGEVAIWGSCSPISQDQLNQCREKGIRFIELPVAKNALVVVVDKRNEFTTQLSTQQLREIFAEDGGARNWIDVQDDWPAIEIDLFVPGTDSSNYQYFDELVMEADDRLRLDVNPPEDDGQMAGPFMGSETGIGFLGAAYYFENTDKLRAVPIVNGDGDAVAPNAETIQSGEYPFSRPLFIYVNEEAAKNPEFAAFVEFYLKNASDIAEDVGYVSLPEKIRQRTLAHFKRRLTGTHFLNSEGVRRSGSLEAIYDGESLIE